MSRFLFGDKELIRSIGNLPDKVFRKGLLKAGRFAVKPIIGTARANIPVDTGTLKKSIGLKVKVYKQSGVAAFVVGPRSGFATTDGKRKLDPRYYAHLVERGHVIRPPATFKSRFGTLKAAVTGQVAARPFLKPAIESQSSVVVGRLAADLGAFIEREAKAKL